MLPVKEERLEEPSAQGGMSDQVYTMTKLCVSNHLVKYDAHLSLGILLQSMNVKMFLTGGAWVA